MSRPAYLQLYEKIRAEILCGNYPHGSRLPGKRSLAEENGVSVLTAAHALEILAEEGYILSRERSGCYVCYRVTDEFSGRPEEKELSGLPSPERRSSADVDGFPSSVLAAAMRRVIADHLQDLARRAPAEGLLSLRQSLSRYLARARGIQAEPERIVMGAGAEYLYGLLAEMLGKDRRWAVESPSYEKIAQVYSARGISPEFLPLGEDGLLSDPLWKSQADILHVSPYRSYPSDVTASASKRAEYLRWAGQKNRLLIEDDYESEFSVRRKPMDPLYSQSDRENVIYLNSFSRTISPGLRAGYMVLPRALMPLFREKVGFYSCTVPVFEQYVLAALIDSGDFERHIRRVRRKLRSASGL